MPETLTAEKLAAAPQELPEFKFWPRHNEALYRRLESKHANVEVKPDDADPLGHQMTLNIGPQHPATHGVLRCVVKLNGEIIEKCVIDLGYLHRGIEKLAENKTFQEFMPYTDRTDYLAPYSNNVGWCLAAEKLANVEVPERAQWIRMVGAELARIQSHLIWLGVGLMDAGATSVFLWTFREREEIYKIMDHLTGARFTVSHCRIGGVANDMTREVHAMIKGFITRLSDEVHGWEKFLNRNRIWVDRIEGVGALTAEQALKYGMSGANLRACGIDYDIRRFEPYLKYEEVDFNIPIRTEGDSLARYLCRMDEIKESIKIVHQCLDRLEHVRGPVRNESAKKSYPSKDEVYYSMEGMIHDFLYTDTGVTPPAGAEAYHAIEAPKGELGFFMISDGTGRPSRVHIKSPSLANIQGLEHMMEGNLVADIVVMIGSVDPVMGDSDK